MYPEFSLKSDTSVEDKTHSGKRSTSVTYMKRQRVEELTHTENCSQSLSAPQNGLAITIQEMFKYFGFGKFEKRDYI